ncbi:MAG: hypothetical protein JEZ04_14165 [Spirochaetales bacterium]|nr:hypothetical protein [Spirochaetales bacterium]
MLKSEIIKGQRSWTFGNGCVHVSVTEAGGHMAPVTFFKDSDNPVEPFYINPWAEEHSELSGLPAVLGPLRGDFFCLPFGGDNSWKGENHPPHGETSEKRWIYNEDESRGSSASFHLDTEVRKGRVTKTIGMGEGENNLYISHRIEGFSGPASLGHHVIFPGGSPKYISTSPIRFGYTDNNGSGGYSGGEYFSLARFQKFNSLKKVPTIWSDKPFTDCSVFPAREGFIDILQVYNEPAGDFAWTAMVVPEERYLWFALKDPEILPSTVLWMENKGRHQHPWNGRNSCLGIEDVCSHLADGLSVSAEDNEIGRQGIKTSHLLNAEVAFEVKYIQGLVRIPEGFDRVSTIEKIESGIRLKSKSGKTASAVVDVSFLS